MKNLVKLKKATIMVVVMMFGIFVFSSCNKNDETIQTAKAEISNARTNEECLYDLTIKGFNKVVPFNMGIYYSDFCLSPIFTNTNPGNPYPFFTMEVQNGGTTCNSTYTNQPIGTYYFKGGSSRVFLKVVFTSGFTYGSTATFNKTTNTWTYSATPGVTISVINDSPVSC